jgi:hypothetical protein
MQAVYRILTDLVVLVDAAFRWGLVGEVQGFDRAVQVTRDDQ